MVDSNDGWAVGEFGTIVHWNGTQWNIVTSPTLEMLNSVFMVNPNDGWAVGYGGAIIHWTGTKWISEFPIAALMSILMILTLLAASWQKTSRKRRNACALTLPPI